MKIRMAVTNSVCQHIYSGYLNQQLQCAGARLKRLNHGRIDCFGNIKTLTFLLLI